MFAIRFTAIVALCAFASCYPDDPCAGDFIFDDRLGLCLSCPAKSKFKNETCECEEEGYEYVGGQCVLPEGAMPPVKDAGPMSDAAAYEGASCSDHCAFITTCLGTNGLATGALPDVVMGLHADDAAECTSSCKSDLGANEATDQALGCIAAGAAGSMCMDPNPQTGLGNTIMLIGECCGPNASSPLCMSMCTTLKANANLSTRVPFCP